MIRDAIGQAFESPLTGVDIVSLVPSTTETLSALGLENKLLGITRFCVHPQHLLSQKTIVGGTKQINWKTLDSLAPDFVLGNKEENTPAIFEALSQRNIPYFVAFPQTVDEAIQDIRTLGILLHARHASQKIVKAIEVQRLLLQSNSLDFSYAYLIWRKPWMTINQDTFIHSMLEEAGGKNVFAGHASRYPQFHLDELKHLQPDLLFLSSEPYPFAQQHIEELQASGFKQNIILINGEMCSWHGSRMISGLSYLQNLIQQIDNGI